MSDSVLRYVERNERWSDNARRKKIGEGALSSFEGTQKCFTQEVVTLYMAKLNSGA